MDKDVMDDDILSLVAQLDLPAMDRDLDAAATTQATKRPKRVRVNTVLQELNALRDEEAELQLQLMKAKEYRTIQRSHRAKENSAWGRRAMQQHTLKLKALRENRELRALLNEHRAYQIQIESTFLKRSSAMMTKLEPEKWRALTLGIHRDERIAAIHAIADRQFDLVESQMIANGLVDPKEDIFVVKSFHNINQLCSEGVRYTTLNMPLDIAMQSVMQVMRERNILVTSNKPTAIPRVQSSNVIFPIDNNTVYVQELLTHPINHIQVVSNMITKRYVHDNQVTVIWRSVMNDEIDTECPKGFVNDECGWVNLEPKGTHTIYRSYLKASSPTPPDDAMSDINDLMNLLRLEPSPQQNGTQIRMDGFLNTIQQSFTYMFQLFEDMVKANGKAMHSSNST